MSLTRNLRGFTITALMAGAGLLGCNSAYEPPQTTTTTITHQPNTYTPVALTSQQQNSQSAAAPAPAAQAPRPAPAVSAENRLYYPTGNRDTSMLLLERSAPAQARLGKPYNYTITVTNLTNAPLQGVIVQEMLPGWFAPSADAAAMSRTAAAPATQPMMDHPMSARTYAIGELKPREVRTLNLTGIASEAGTLSSCTSVVCNPTLCTTAMVINPQIRISKAALGSGDLCEIQTIRYTVSNTGTGDATGVRIDDQLPDGLTIDPGTSNRVSQTVGTIAQGQSRTIDIKVRAARAGEFASAASVIADDGLTARSEPLAMAIKAPKLEISLKAPEKEYLGSPLKYEVTVKNVGNAIARNPIVRIDAAGEPAAAARPGAAREDSAQLAAARQGGQSVGELAPGASKTITVAYTPRVEGDLRVNAIATDACAEAAMAAGLTRVTSLPALLLSAVDDHDPIRVGENVTYTITVLNQGFGSDRNIRVVATLPDGQQYVSSSGASQGTLEGNKLTFAPVASIAAKQTLTWTLTVKATKVADVRLRVDMSSDSFPDAAVKMEPTRLY